MDLNSDVKWLVGLYCMLCAGRTSAEMRPLWLRCADGTVLAFHCRVSDLVHDDRRLIGDGAGLEWLADIERLREQEHNAIGVAQTSRPPRDWGPMR